MLLQYYLDRMPLVAILRGVTPSTVLQVGDLLVSAGFAIIEVPLNSPRAFESIRLLSEEFGSEVLVGAGTVTTEDEVYAVAAAGGRIIVMPHADCDVIRAAKGASLICAPGVMTPTEAFSALRAGADALKLFPAEQMSPNFLKAIAAVLPAGVKLIPVGGLKPENLAIFSNAGASGFGLGSSLFSRTMSNDELRSNAAAFVDAWRSIKLGR